MNRFFCVHKLQTLFLVQAFAVGSRGLTGGTIEERPSVDTCGMPKLPYMFFGSNVFL